MRNKNSFKPREERETKKRHKIALSLAYVKKKQYLCTESANMSSLYHITMLGMDNALATRCYNTCFTLHGANGTLPKRSPSSPAPSSSWTIWRESHYDIYDNRTSDR